MTAEFFPTTRMRRFFLFNLPINFQELGQKKVDEKLFTISNLQKTCQAGLSGLMLKIFHGWKRIY